MIRNRLLLLSAFILYSISNFGQTVTQLQLIDASSQQVIKSMNADGDSIDLNKFPNLNFRALTDPEPLPSGQRCDFKLTYPSEVVFNHSEGVSVYACFGDNSGNYNDWASGASSSPAIEMGKYTLEITPGNGTVKTYKFYIYNSAGSNTNNTNTETAITIDPGEIQITGEKKQWHNIIFSVGGPASNENATPNPFLDYRFDILFTKGNLKMKIPGYYAADGNSKETGAISGNVWRAHFCPPETGTWNYTLTFLSGKGIAVDETVTGTPFAELDGSVGSIDVTNSDKTGRDLRAKGRLQYVGERYLQFAGNKEWFLKAGADAPENFLAYDDFDNTTNIGGLRKSWAPHIQDWKTGDPTWQNDKGKGIIGAVNYLSSKGMNAFSFLTMNINGDDKNVFPYISTSQFTRFDCSKLDQWEVVFSHADSMGMYLHFKTQETENDQLLDNGNLGVQRKIYYRELIARFGHHLALNWNLGEENSQTTAQRQAMAQYFHDNDPYHSNIVLHTGPNKQDAVYTPLLGNASSLTGVSIQTGWNNVYAETLKWVTESKKAGKNWIVANDEQNGANIGVPDDAYTGTPNTNDIRKETLWGDFMAGGAGVEYYFGYSRPESDLTCQDFRSREMSWNFAKIALDFFHQYVPFWEMTSNASLTTNGWCMAKEGEKYLIYLKNGGSASLTISSPGTYEVNWFDPRNGGDLLTGSVQSISVAASGKFSIGNPPNNFTEDWAVLISRSSTTDLSSEIHNTEPRIWYDKTIGAIQIVGIQQNEMIKVYTSSGQVIKSGVINSGTNSIQLPYGSKGIFLIKTAKISRKILVF